jgi:acetyl esterase/lipase
MLLLKTLFRFLKKLAIFILVVTIAISLQYGSTNHQYLGLRSVHSILSLTYSVVTDQIRPTLSADYRAFETIVRLNPIAEGDPLKDATIIIKNLRSTLVISTIVPKPAECQKFQRHTDQLILFFHGGGYIMGNIHSKLSYMCDWKNNRFVLYFDRP